MRVPLVLLCASALAFAACDGDEHGAEGTPPAGPAPEGGAPPGDLPDADADVADTDTDAGPFSSDPKSRSGTRLHRELWSGGGASILRAFVDTERGDVRCSFVPAEDGALRCIPFEYGQPEYLDAECTQLVHTGPIATPNGEPRNELIVWEGPACARRAVVYSLGDPIVPPATRYRRTSTGVCDRASPVPEGWEVRATTAKVPATVLVEGRSVVESSTKRLRRRLLTSSDGAFYADAPWDDTMQDVCKSIPDETGVSRCIAGTFSSVRYADNACEQLVASVDSTCETAPKTMLYRLDGPVGPLGIGPLVVRRVGAKHSGRVYSKSFSGCLDSTGVGTAVPHVTTPMALSEFQQVETAFAGPGRIQRVVLRSADGDLPVRVDVSPVGAASPPTEVAWDQTLGAACGLRQLGTEVKCVPHSISGGLIYTDAECKQPVIRDFGATSLKYLTTGGALDLVIYKLAPTSRKVTSTWGLNGTSDCVPVHQGPDEIAVYDVGAVVPRSELVTFERRIE